MPIYFDALDPAVILEAAWAAWLADAGWADCCVGCDGAVGG